MPPQSKKKKQRPSPLVGSRGGRSDVDGRRDSAEISNAAAGPSSVPQSQPPIRPSRSENNIVESSIPGTQGLRPPQAFPVLQSYDNPPTYRAHGAPESHGSQSPIRQLRSRSKNNTAESSQCAARSITSNQDLRPPHQSLPALQPADNPALPRVHGGTTSFLAGASSFRMRDIYYYEASQPANPGGGASIDGWELLLRNIAPNALHDSRARYDTPKCDEDTRVEVIREIMECIQDPNAPQRLLCMTGAAGSGKSALEQTIAELCIESDILSATFFLSSADPTRNNISFIVPTIAYQIGLKHRLFRTSVAAAVENDRHIFSRSLRSQMDVLIVRPFESLRRTEQISINTFPYAILIDGLDECNSESNTTSRTTTTLIDVDDRRRAEDQQEELLAAIKHCILDNDLPFRVFIASRPEWAIRTALQPGGFLHELAYHIQLSDKYDASADMCRYLRRRFEVIGLRIGDSQWFSEDDIETLVRAGSGQFVYVATVYKYISERRAYPAQRLKVVLTWTPRAGQVAKPFEALDRLYSNILLTAKEAYDAVDTHHGRDFLLLFRVHHVGRSGFLGWDPISADVISVLMCLEARAEESLISDLHSLVAFETNQWNHLGLHFYHKSFSDFLEEPSRAKDLFIPKSQVYMHFAKCCMQNIIECPLDFDSLPTKWDEIPLPVLYRRSLKEAVQKLPTFLQNTPALDDDEVVGFTQNGGWERITSFLPLLFGFMFAGNHSFATWTENLLDFADRLKARKPEVAATILVLVEKWKKDCKPYT